MQLKKKAQGMVPEKIIQIVLIVALLVLLMIIMWIIFSDKGAKIWSNIVSFMRFGTG
jgi:hypothetical protein